MSASVFGLTDSSPSRRSLLHFGPRPLDIRICPLTQAEMSNSVERLSKGHQLSDFILFLLSYFFLEIFRMTPEICFCSRKPCGVTLLRSLLQLSRTFPKLFSVVLISAFCSPPNVLITLRRAFQLCTPGFLGFLLFPRGFKRPR